jgi:hypothetical protein
MSAPAHLGARAQTARMAGKERRNGRERADMKFILEAQASIVKQEARIAPRTYDINLTGFRGKT